MAVHPAVAAARLRNIMLLADEGLRVGRKAGDLLEELLAAFAEIPASPPMPTMPQSVWDAMVDVMVEYAEASAKVTIEQYGDCPAATASYKDHRAAYGQPTESAQQIANVPHDTFICAEHSIKAGSDGPLAAPAPEIKKTLLPPHMRRITASSSSTIPSSTIPSNTIPSSSSSTPAPDIKKTFLPPHMRRTTAPSSSTIPSSSSSTATAEPDVAPPTTSEHDLPLQTRNNTEADVPAILQLSYVDWSRVPQHMRLRDVVDDKTPTSLMQTFVPGPKRSKTWSETYTGANVEEDTVEVDDRLLALDVIGLSAALMANPDVMEYVLARLTMPERHALMRTNLAVHEAIEMYLMTVAPGRKSNKITVGRNFITIDPKTGMPGMHLLNEAFDVDQQYRFVVKIMGAHIADVSQMALAIYAACHPGEDFDAKRVPVYRLEFIECSYISMEILPELIKLFPNLVSIGLYNCPLVDFASFAQRSMTNPIHHNLRQLEHLDIRIDFTLCEPPPQKWTHLGIVTRARAEWHNSLPNLAYGQLVWEQAKVLSTQPGHTVLRQAAYHLSKVEGSNDDPTDWNKLKVRYHDKFGLTRLVALTNELAKDKGRLSTSAGLKAGVLRGDQDAMFVLDAFVALFTSIHVKHRMTSRQILQHDRAEERECRICEKQVLGIFFVTSEFAEVLQSEDGGVCVLCQSAEPASDYVNEVLRETGAPDLRAIVTQFHTIRQDDITGKAKRGSSFTLVENFRVLRSREMARVYHYVATTWEAYAPGYVNTETAMVKYQPTKDARLVEMMVLAKQKRGEQPGWYKAWSAMRSSGNNPPRPGGSNNPPRPGGSNNPPRPADGNHPPRRADGNNPPRPADGSTNLSANAAGKLPAVTIMKGATSNPAFCGIGGISGVAFVRNLTRLMLIRSICATSLERKTSTEKGATGLCDDSNCTKLHICRPFFVHHLGAEKVGCPHGGLRVIHTLEGDARHIVVHELANCFRILKRGGCRARSPPCLYGHDVPGERGDAVGVSKIIQHRKEPGTMVRYVKR